MLLQRSRVEMCENEINLPLNDQTIQRILVFSAFSAFSAVKNSLMKPRIPRSRERGQPCPRVRVAEGAWRTRFSRGAPISNRLWSREHRPTNDATANSEVSEILRRGNKLDRQALPSRVLWSPSPIGWEGRDSNFQFSIFNPQFSIPALPISRPAPMRSFLTCKTSENPPSPIERAGVRGRASIPVALSAKTAHQIL